MHTILLLLFCTPTYSPLFQQFLQTDFSSESSSFSGRRHFTPSPSAQLTRATSRRALGLFSPPTRLPSLSSHTNAQNYLLDLALTMPTYRGRSIAFVADIYDDTIFTSTLTTTARAAKLLSVAVATAAAAAKLLLPFKRALPTVVQRGQSIRLRLPGRPLPLLRLSVCLSFGVPSRLNDHRPVRRRRQVCLREAHPLALAHACVRARRRRRRACASTPPPRSENCPAARANHRCAFIEEIDML